MMCLTMFFTYVFYFLISLYDFIKYNINTKIRRNLEMLSIVVLQNLEEVDANYAFQHKIDSTKLKLHIINKNPSYV